MNTTTKPLNKNIALSRSIYIDLIKTIAIICVIIIHTTSLSFTGFKVMSANYFFTAFLSCATRIAVPLFVMCSGAVFLNMSKEIPTKKIYKTYIPRLLASLIIFALFYEGVDILFSYLATGVFDISVIKACINNLLTFSTHFHLYYLYIIIFIYCLVPIIRVYLKSATQKDLKYLLTFLFITASVLPFLRCFFPLNRYFGSMTLQYSLNLTYGMLVYFMSGHYLNTYEISKKAFKITSILGILGVIVTFGGTTLHTIKNGYLTESFISAMTPFVLFSACAVFIGIKKSSSKIHSEKITKVITYISKSSFCIYLIHHFYIMVLERLGLTIFAFTPFLSLPLVVILTFLLSVATYVVLSKVPLLRKIV